MRMRQDALALDHTPWCVFSHHPAECHIVILPEGNVKAEHNMRRKAHCPHKRSCVLAGVAACRHFLLQSRSPRNLAWPDRTVSPAERRSKEHTFPKVLISSNSRSMVSLHSSHMCFQDACLGTFSTMPRSLFRADDRDVPEHGQGEAAAGYANV